MTSTTQKNAKAFIEKLLERLSNAPVEPGIAQDNLIVNGTLKGVIEFINQHRSEWE